MDECLGEAIVRGLRANGDDVVWVRDIETGASDAEVLAWSVDDNRILVTEDFDFGELVFGRGQPAIGVVIVVLESYGDVWEERASEVVRHMIENAGSFETNLSILERKRTKVRPLRG